MKVKPMELTCQMVRGAFSYDPATGAFKWAINNGRARAGDTAGTPMRDGHLQVGLHGANYLVHRLIWLHMYGRWPFEHIDHIDGDPRNNRIDNLREATHQENQQNVRRARRDNRSTGMLGAHFLKRTGRFCSSIGINGRQIHLGYFDTPEEAHAAYIAAKRRHHDGCTI